MKLSKIFIAIIVQFTFIYSFAQDNKVTVNLVGGVNTKMRQNAELNIAEMINEINKAYQSGTDLSYKFVSITNEAIKNLNSMWSFNTFYCPKDTISESLTKSMQNYEIRNVEIVIDNENQKKSQEVAIEVNENGIITDIYFSLQQFQYKNIMATGNSVIEETRLNIMRNFLENMKTAYMRKDIEFIDNIFSDKALIIVGKKLQKTNQQTLALNTSNKEIKFDDNNNTQFRKLTKAQYIANLKRLFLNNKKIFIDFDNIEIVRHQKKGYESYYGVRLKQDWKSDRYQDTGIVFFVIEFRENDDPLIWVRVWQDANSTEKSQLVGLGDIKIKPNTQNSQK